MLNTKRKLSIATLYSRLRVGHRKSSQTRMVKVAKPMSMTHGMCDFDLNKVYVAKSVKVGASISLRGKCETLRL